jgi:hypothetical protein
LKKKERMKTERGGVTNWKKEKERTTRKHGRFYRRMKNRGGLF